MTTSTRGAWSRLNSCVTEWVRDNDQFSVVVLAANVAKEVESDPDWHRALMKGALLIAVTKEVNDVIRHEATTRGVFAPEAVSEDVRAEALDGARGLAEEEWPWLKEEEGGDR